MDTLGNPLRFILTPGQKHDITNAKELTENISNIIVLADKGYDTANANTTVTKNHHRPIKAKLKSIHRHQIARINPSPSINHNSKIKSGNNTLIKLKTTHPYRS
jgi:IS5 family transposase